MTLAFLNLPQPKFHYYSLFIANARPLRLLWQKHRIRLSRALFCWPHYQRL